MAKVIFPRFDEKKAKPYTGSKEDFPTFNESEAKDYEGSPISVPSMGETALETVTQVGALADVPGAATRSAVTGRGKEFIQNLPKMGPRAVFEAPTGEEVLDEYGLLEDVPEPLQGAAGVVTEMALDPTLVVAPLRKGLSKLGEPASKALRSAMEAPIERQYSKVLEGIRPTTEALEKINVNPKILSAVAFEEKLTKMNPSKALDEIYGVRKITKTPKAGGFVVGEKKLTPGRITEASDDLKGAINEVSGFSDRVDRKYITDPVSAEWMNKFDDPNSPEYVPGVKKSQRQRYIDKLESQIQGPIKGDSYSIEELFNMKRELGKKLDSPTYYAPASKKIAQEKAINLSLQRRIDDIIKEKLAGRQIERGGQMVDAGEYYELQNSRMHRMIQLKDLLKSVPRKELKKVDMPALISAIAMRGAALGGAGLTAEALGVPYGSMAGMVGAALESSRQAANATTRNFPGFATRSMEAVSDIPKIVPPLAGQSQRSLTDEESQRAINAEKFGRSPDSVNLPLNLSKTKLPRTTEGIMENKDIFLAKVAQEAPQYFDQVNFVLNERPEDLDQMMPMLVNFLPQAFDHDKYGRVNNEILDPMMMDKARKDISNDGNLSNTQKAIMINKLNRTNILEDY